MYPEFVGIYVCLLLIIIMLAAVIVMLTMLLNRKKKKGKQNQNTGTYTETAKGTRICMNCMKKYDSNLKSCPHCGTKR